MDYHEIIQMQYLAALGMLKEVIVKCPAALWNAAGDTDPCWRKVYHALYYTHLYLQTTNQEFNPWVKHHDPDTGEPFTQAEMLEYLAFAQAEVGERIPNLDMEAGSGFDWLPISKFELQIYNIRHIQQHVGEMYERLGSREKIELDWIDSPRII